MFKILKENIGNLPEEIKSLLTETDDGYTLDPSKVMPREDLGALKRAKEYEKEARKKAEEKVNELKKELNKKEKEVLDLRTGAVPKDDFDALKSSYEEKMKKIEGELKEQIEARTKALNEILIDSVASEVATEISTVPSLMKKEVISRLTIEEENGKFVTKVIDKEGKPSAMTLEELKKEFLENKDFAPVLIGSKASGSGASGSRGAGGSDKKLSEMTGEEKINLFRNDRARYDMLLEQEGGKIPVE